MLFPHFLTFEKKRSDEAVCDALFANEMVDRE